MKYLFKSYYWEKLVFSKLWFSKFKKFVSRSVLGELYFAQVSLNFKTSCCDLKIRCLGTKLCVASLFFNFESINDVLKSKSSYFFLKKNINFNKNEAESKMENPHKVLERRTLCFNSYKNCKLKVRLWWAVTPKRKKRTFFEPLIFSEWNFIVLNELSQYTYFYISKTITYLKSSKALSISLMWYTLWQNSYFNVFQVAFSPPDCILGTLETLFVKASLYFTVAVVCCC